MAAPLYEHLIAYHSQNRISFAMPGHKNGRGLRGDLLGCDVTELRATEDLRRPREFIRESQRLLSELYSSDESFIVTCGSTAAVQAMIAAAVPRGGTLAASSDCHKSVINTCALLGIKLKFIPAELDGDFLITRRLADVEPYIDGADAVMVTSPTYYGLCADTEKISAACHRRGIPLLTDEAHGAHFAADARFPRGAVMCGADAVCQSAHKTLGALTGAAYLHVRSDLLDRGKIRRALEMFQTSSPSYVIAASADIARGETENGGWGGIIAECDKFRREITAETEIKVLENDDPTRLVLNFGAYETAGFKIDEILSEKYGIDAEMADLLNLILIVTPYNTAEDIKALKTALCEVTRTLMPRTESAEIPPPLPITGVISPGDALFARTCAVALGESEGETAAATVCAYPPGIPIICMGAEITHEQIEYVKFLKRAGAELTGLENDMVEIADKRKNYE